MPRIPLLGGTYQAKSVIANAQASINLYAESNPGQNQAPTQVTHYQTPGLDLLIQGDGFSPVRCVYRASNGQLFAVIGSQVYYINSAFNKTLLGVIGTNGTPVIMQDNGLVIIIADGSVSGYAIELGSHNFGIISGVNFYGATSVSFLDTFFILNIPGSNQFYISLSNVTYAMLIGGTGFDPNAVASKSGYPDAIASIIVIQGYIWLIGTLSAEVWYNSGAPDFPFQRLTGVNIIQHGTIAPYSLCAQDLFPYWLTQDEQGQSIIVKGVNYQLKRISTHAIEQELNTYSTVSDCIGCIYQQEGHVFIIFIFPTANKTWVYDEASEQWHQRAYTDNDGNLLRHRINCTANAYGKNVVGDWQNGNIYAFNQQTYTDNGQPISRIRRFPHLLNDGKRMIYTQFLADMAVGNDDGSVDASTPDNPPVVYLRYSDDRGVTYGNKLAQSLGAGGQYLTSIQYQRLGLARDRVFELSWSAPCNTALQGAWLTGTPAGT